MKFVDELFQMYRHHLTGDEEDTYAIVLGVLEDFERNDLEALIEQLSDEECFEMVTSYIFELFRRKVAEEGIGQVGMMKDGKGTLLH